jgi:hypothetical protein
VESFPYWTNTRGGNARDRAEFSVKLEGGRTMKLTISTPGEFKVVHGSAPDVPPRRNEVLYIEVMGETASFRTVWEP